jgi:acetyl-CoA C-acetyltransferase
MSEEAFIYEAIRTPRGKQRNGSLNEVKPVNLVVGLIEELRSRHPDLDENLISDLILGVVSPVGDQGGDIARTAALVAKLPETTGGFQLNRFGYAAAVAIIGAILVFAVNFAIHQGMRRLDRSSN